MVPEMRDMTALAPAGARAPISAGHAKDLCDEQVSNLTLNFHITKECNMKCKMCFAKFPEHEKEVKDLALLVDMFKKAGEAVRIGSHVMQVRKVNLVGGEPLLRKYVCDGSLLQELKALGYETSIVTNGSLMTADLLKDIGPHLDQIGFSIDSRDPEVNRNLGRCDPKRFFGDQERCVNEAIALIHAYNESHAGPSISIKVNTTVSRKTLDEDFGSFFELHRGLVSRWKIFQVVFKKRNNDDAAEMFQISDEEFRSFVDRHERDLAQKDLQLKIVDEDNDAMRHSYLILAPDTCLQYDNDCGGDDYSASRVVDVGLEYALSQTSRDFQNSLWDKFRKRGGNYSAASSSSCRAKCSQCTVADMF